ncbi:serine hydrolase domain-containing protein [Desertivirga xinjiangensis]|uniref:serine hydrolase domain-containing protein n=1 Tax=Desertivirga xinjiangensis TaxID=539206 RepID=UPI00210ED629|nr:serine hydrolase [Pedobacter xinjiangensis]
MRQRPFRFSLFTTILLVLLLACILIYLTGTTYIYKALLHRQADIDDINIFPTREVKQGKNNVAWPRATKYNKAPLSDTLRKTLLETESVAFLIIKNDSLVHEEYWDGYTDSTLSNPFSITKSIVSLLVGAAIKDGHIRSVNQPVSDFLPEFKESEKSKITIKHLLQMTSGLDFMESYSSPFNYTTEAYYGTDLKGLVGKLKVIETPGTVSRYKSGDTQVLGMLLSQATGRTLSDYASEKLWEKLGVESAAEWSLDHVEGVEKAYCCFYTNARDLAKIGKLVLQNGKYNGEQLIDSAYMQASFVPVGLPDQRGNLTDYYGYSWWLIHRGGVQVNHARGLAGQYLFVIPSQNMIVVRLGKKRASVKQNGVSVDILIYLDEVLKMMKNN